MQTQVRKLRHTTKNRNLKMLVVGPGIEVSLLNTEML